MTSPQRKGLTRVEVCIGVACAVALMAMCSLLVGQDGFLKPVDNPRTVKDAMQLADIHKAMLIYSGDNKGRMPRPGLINRKPVDGLGEVAGMGEENILLNTTANLFSALICQRFISPEIVIAPVERNPHVKLVDNYDYDAYNPANDTYWDSSFTGDLETGSNASYAHMSIDDKQWINGMLAMTAQLGNRGPKDGLRNPDSFTCGPHGNWAGNITFGDNHTEFLESTSPEHLRGDNLFARNEHVKDDSLLAFIRLAKAGELARQFD
jgi:hypothetical protein